MLVMGLGVSRFWWPVGLIDELVPLPGVGHDLPAAVWPRMATEVRALADRAPVSTRG